MSKRKLEFESVLCLTVPVVIGGDKFTLREADGKAMAEFKSRIFSTTSINKDGTASLGQMAYHDLNLLSSCLFDSSDKNVPVEILEKWPQRICETLIDELKEMSGLRDEKPDKEESKN